MILQCPRCNARFTVPDTAIPPQGRMVKCSKCAHAWHTSEPKPEDVVVPEPAPIAPVPEVPPPAMDEVNVVVEPAPIHTPEPSKTKPLAIPTKPFIIATPALAAMWLLFAFMGHYDSWISKPVLGAVYKTFGMQPTDGLAFEDVAMQHHEKDGKTQYILAGSIANHASVDRIVPSVRVMLNDKNGKTLWEREYVVKESLKGGEVYPFRITNVETAFGDSVTSIVVDVGHKLQLMMR